LNWKKIFDTPKNWEIKLSKKRTIVLAFVLFIMGLLLSPHLSDILSARQEYIAEQQSYTPEAGENYRDLYGNVIYGDNEELRDKILGDDVGVVLTIDPQDIKVFILETDALPSRTEALFDPSTIGRHFTCFVDIPLDSKPYIEYPLSNKNVLMYTTGIYGGPHDVNIQAYAPRKPKALPKYKTYLAFEEGQNMPQEIIAMLNEKNRKRIKTLDPYVGFILVPSSVARNIRGKYKDHFELLTPEETKIVADALGVKISDKQSKQYYPGGILNALSFKVNIRGVNAAYEQVMKGESLHHIVTEQYIPNYNYTIEGDHIHLTFQGEVSDIRYFEIELSEIKLIKSALQFQSKDQEIVDALDVRKLKIINGFSGDEVGDFLYLFTPVENSEILNLALEVTCWTKDMRSYFQGEQETTYTDTPKGFKRKGGDTISVGFDEKVLLNPKMGKPIYKIVKDGKETTVIEWGALTIDVDYKDVPSEFLEYLTFVIMVRFPDPFYQPNIIYDLSQDPPIRTIDSNIYTIWLMDYADVICGQEWIPKQTSKGLIYVAKSGKKQIWVPIINGKFTEENVTYDIYFNVYPFSNEEFLNKIGKNKGDPLTEEDLEKVQEHIVAGQSFNISVQAGGSYRTSTKRIDRCSKWRGGWGWRGILPENVREFFYTMCQVQETIKRALEAVKDTSAIILGGGPSATIDMAREYGGKGDVAKAYLLGLITYLMFILALLIIVVGLIGMNLDMAWFGARIWIFLAVFSWAQVAIGHYFQEPFGMFSLVGSFFGAVYHYAEMFWHDLTSATITVGDKTISTPGLWGLVATAILVLWFLQGRRS